MICKVFVAYDRLERFIDGLEVCSKEIRLDLCKFIKLNKCLLANCLIVITEGLSHDLRH